jgi:hypothetical protein
LYQWLHDRLNRLTGFSEQVNDQIADKDCTRFRKVGLQELMQKGKDLIYAGPTIWTSPEHQRSKRCSWIALPLQ